MSPEKEGPPTLRTEINRALYKVEAKYHDVEGGWVPIGAIRHAIKEALERDEKRRAAEKAIIEIVECDSAGEPLHTLLLRVLELPEFQRYRGEVIWERVMDMQQRYSDASYDLDLATPAPKEKE